MTTETDLLPLPKWMSNYTIPADDFECDKGVMLVDRMHDYASANVSRATARLQAEIEALRAEVERLRADRDCWEQQASDRVADWHAEHLRAERLAEALREISTLDYKNAATNGAAYEAVQIASRVLMNQEARND